ncbi:MAG: hypothetical protein HIU91_11925 [Acidobacteria bacterium]|nr:hypothetical protein [Acidobacteriota bacterium]
MKTKVKIGIWIIVVAGFSLLSGTCGAQSTCPWLNAATASGVLAGPATVEVNNTGAGTGSCVFRLLNGASDDTLRIAVTKADHAEDPGGDMKPYESGCTSPKASLRAIGNEAVLCASNKGLARSELVVGRVRANIFTVDINTGTGNGSQATRDVLAAKVEEIARQVAGALF